MKKILLLVHMLVAAVCLLSFTSVLSAKTISVQHVEKAVKSWLKGNPKPLRTKLGRQIDNVQLFSDSNGIPVYYVVYLSPSGFIIAPADDDIEPVIAFSSSDTYNPSDENPLGALVSRDLPARLTAIRELDFHIRTTGDNKNLATYLKACKKARNKARKKWALLKNNGPGEISDGQEAPSEAPVSNPDDIRVAPFVQSLWSQSTECGYACYNYYTPPNSSGNANNYVSGCVATALAQLLRFYQYPTDGIGINTFSITVDGSPQDANTIGGDGLGGAYNWADMVLDPNCSNYSDTRWAAIGALCYDAGLSVNMNYASDGSSANTLDAKDALINTFDYNSAVEGYNNGSNIGAGLNAMINPNLDYGGPVILGITGSSGGHAVIADGYGYNSTTLYHHLNMGWAGTDNTWYNLPDIASTPAFSSVYKCVYNIFISDSGEIISGRVTNANGNPIEDATVTAAGSGGPYITTTNENGIYAIANLPSDTTFTMSVEAFPYHFESHDVITATSSDLQSTSGNRWMIDFNGYLTANGADLDNDDMVDFNDFAIFARYWLNDDCDMPPNCEGADFEPDGDVDYNDLDEFTSHWLKIPENSFQGQQSFYSIGDDDGRVWGSGGGTGKNSTDNDNKALRLGDHIVGACYRTILSFDTELLPDDANVTAVTLRLTCGYQEGADPFSWAGQCLVDVNTNSLGTTTDLENYDWQAAANAVATAAFSGNPGVGNSMVSSEFDANGMNNINKNGKTQIRVYFENLTNSDSYSDYLGFYSGHTAQLDEKPMLTVTYTTETAVVSCNSIPQEDGWVSDNNDGIGGNNNSSETIGLALRLGDWSGNQGFRTVLSFDTSILPDDANLISATLKLTRGVNSGTDPFTWGGQCLIDVNSPFLGTTYDLENYDWQAPSAAAAVAAFTADPGLDKVMTSTEFDPNGLGNISKTGKTQIRVYFENANNANSSGDYLGFYPGEAEDPNKSPKLIIQYKID